MISERRTRRSNSDSPEREDRRFDSDSPERESRRRDLEDSRSSQARRDAAERASRARRLDPSSDEPNSRRARHDFNEGDMIPEEVNRETPAPRHVAPSTPPAPASMAAPAPAATAPMPAPACTPHNAIAPVDESELSKLAKTLEAMGFGSGVGFVIKDDGRLVPLNAYHLSPEADKYVTAVHDCYHEEKKKLRPCAPFWFFNQNGGIVYVEYDENDKIRIPMNLRDDAVTLKRIGAKTTDSDEDYRVCRFLLVDSKGNPKMNDVGDFLPAKKDEIAAWRSAHPEIA